MLANWQSAVRRFRQVVPVARVQAQAAPEPATEPSPESVPKTAA
jgi:hypothetical protein